MLWFCIPISAAFTEPPRSRMFFIILVLPKRAANVVELHINDIIRVRTFGEKGRIFWF